MQLHTCDPIRFLKGVGERRGELYAKLDIFTVEDLLRHYPRTYIDLSQPVKIAAAPFDMPCAVLATVLKKSGEQRLRGGLCVFKVSVTDGESDMNISFFNTKYTVDALTVGCEYIFYGKLSGGLLRREMSSPMVLKNDPERCFVPVYSLTAGLSSKMISTNMVQALTLINDETADILPDDIRRKYELCHSVFALHNIHFPKNQNALEAAKRRLIFEELLLLSLSMSQLKSGSKAQTGAKMCFCKADEFYNSLPFKPTNAQKRVISECFKDLSEATPMNRLVQGDVGCGKTLVAAACIFFTLKNGCQSAMMAPTEILAEQHYKTLAELLKPFSARIGLLTGSLTAVKKRELKAQLKNGEIDLVIGTHALLQENVEFKSLGLVITDEQHRFGVGQRLKLAQKGINPHVLVMSATPIPRTLALIIYGDLDISVIDELPLGRQPIKTYIINPAKRHRAFGFIKKHLDLGEQCYIVCPLVEQGDEDLGLEDVRQYAKRLCSEDFAGYSVAVLHGKMKPAEKEKTMRTFAEGKTQLLVATTVIEVGVDVPNASVMLIENAERFGLSQLHQLRGRIGRGSCESTCILVTESELDRLSVIKSTSDGFKIAEEDLKLRGPGDFFGSRQHGLPKLKIANMLTDINLLKLAQNAAAGLLCEDPALTMASHNLLKNAVQKLFERADI
ncbi:MAG: ATP-dependent DNA helicase RecG [Hydrogenoanaerobacterium sp.]